MPLTPYASLLSASAAAAAIATLPQCGLQQVTRSTGARSAADCVAPAGFALASPAAAVACGRSEYAPQFNRLAKCLRCQSGLVEPAGSNLADGQRASKKAVCSEWQVRCAASMGIGASRAAAARRRSPY